VDEKVVTLNQCQADKSVTNFAGFLLYIL